MTKMFKYGDQVRLKAGYMAWFKTSGNGQPHSAAQDGALGTVQYVNTTDVQITFSTWIASIPFAWLELVESLSVAELRKARYEKYISDQLSVKRDYDDRLMELAQAYYNDLTRLDRRESEDRQRDQNSLKE